MNEEKIASVRIIPDDMGRGVSIGNVTLDHEGATVYFPCARDRIGGISYYKKPTKRQKRKEVSVSFTEYLKKLEKRKYKKIIFGDKVELEI